MYDIDRMIDDINSIKRTIMNTMKAHDVGKNEDDVYLIPAYIDYAFPLGPPEDEYLLFYFLERTFWFYIEFFEEVIDMIPGKTGKEIRTKWKYREQLRRGSY